MSAGEVMNALRCLGFQASVRGLKPGLKAAKALKEPFLELVNLIPQTGHLLEEFLRAGDLEPFFLFHEIGAGEADSSDTSHPLLAALCRSSLNLEVILVRPGIGEMIAFHWLLCSAIRTQPVEEISAELSKFVEAGISAVRLLNSILQDYPTFGEGAVSIRVGLQAWAEYWASEIAEGLQKTELIRHSPDVLREGIQDSLNFLQRITFLPEPESIWIEREEHAIEGVKRKPVQRGSSLKNRERLRAHQNAFRADELKDVIYTIPSRLEGQGLHRNLHDLDTPYYVEALLICLALATGRSVKGVLDLPLDSAAKEYVKLELFSGHGNKFLYPVWYRKLSNGVALSLPLPSFLKDPFKRNFRMRGAERISDCLPYTTVEWEKRCLQWLCTLTGSSSRLDLKVRDELARSTYQASSSAFLVETLTNPVDEDRFSADSSAYYLDPLNLRTLETYKAACKNIFGKHGIPKQFDALFRSEHRYAVRADEQQSISRLLLSRIEDATASKDPVAYHNALSLYLLMLLVVATGHRKSTTPFFFPWDVLDEENLAFISDKQVAGSEARFIPVPAWLSNMVVEYRHHLLRFASLLQARHPGASDSIFSLLHAKANISRRSRRKTEGEGGAGNRLGMFFTVDGQGRASTLATADLEAGYEPDCKKRIGEFRRCIANSLWSQGLSGYQVEAFLGHNGELHMFGESSSWSILEWADEIRPAQEKYLEERGWIPVKIQSLQHQSKLYEPSVPSFYSSQSGYELRSRSNMQALARASKIVRQVLPQGFFSVPGFVLNDEDYDRLLEGATNSLSDDPEAQRKVQQAMRICIRRIRTSSAKASLLRTEPGPISVTSSRHCAIAKQFRDWWLARLGSPQRDNASEFQTRLSSIGISLVVFDAILDKSVWRALLCAIAAGEVRSARGCLLVRVRIEKHFRVYEKSHIISPLTAAQVVGLLDHQKAENMVPIKGIMAFVEKQLASSPLSSSAEKPSIDTLISVFRPWWVLRLPGALYSIAIGDHCGPAADIRSECALFGFRPDSMEVSQLPKMERGQLAAAQQSPQEAIRAFGKFLAKAAGIFEELEATTRSQRARLRSSLENKMPDSLRVLAEHQQIVMLMIDFLRYLLEEGGKRKDILKFSTIRTYFTNIRGLVTILWDCDLYEFDSTDYDDAYNKLLGSNKLDVNIADPLALFHQFLRSAIGAPYSSVASEAKRPVQQCRAAVVTCGQLDDAYLNLGSAIPVDSQLANHAKTFLSLCYIYGLRRQEALGIQASDLLSHKSMELKIRKNRSRDLKSGSSLRIVNPFGGDRKQLKHLSAKFSFHSSVPERNEFVFVNPEARDELYPAWDILSQVTRALRRATGNPNVVIHSLRHSAASRITHRAFKHPRAIPVSKHVEDNLIAGNAPELFEECFDTGFFAWPFWVERVAMLLGHADVDTSLDNYYHLSSVGLAEHIWFASQNITLNQEQLASLLHKHRTAVTHQLGRLRKRNTSSESLLNDHEALISHYVQKSKIPAIGNNRQLKLKIQQTIDADTNPESNLNEWISIDRLLVRRLNEKLLLGTVDNQWLGRKRVQDFFESYLDIVAKTGFDDFEPVNSEVLAKQAPRNSGVLRGAKERERGIAAAQRVYMASKVSAEKLSRFCRHWIATVDCDDPWFVANSTAQAMEILEILTDLGVSKGQIEFCTFNFDIAELRAAASWTSHNNVYPWHQRFSRGPRRVRVSELGIKVIQQKSAKIGDHRDTHRLVLVISSICNSLQP